MESAFIYMPEALKEVIPAIYAQETLGDEAIIHAHYFLCGWDWFATEYDPEERKCFGLVRGFDTELGYFSLDEMEEAVTPQGLRIERDLYWDPCTIAEVRKRLNLK